MRANGRGFTLVELLVVITIIGILIALLLPAVQAAREASRRVQCSNNMKQIGLALHNYHMNNQCFPPGSFWFGLSYGEYRGSILVRLLPYLEQQAIFDLFDFKSYNPTIDNQMLPGGGNLIQSKVIPAYVCPSDSRPLTLNAPPWERALHNYAASIGPTTHGNNGNCSCAVYASWNAYAPPPWGGVYGGAYAGPFFRYPNPPSRIVDCRDGLSNTIYFGEVRPLCSAHNMGGWATSNNGQGLTSTLPPINWDTCDPNAPDPCYQPCNWNMELGFKSRHPGGAQFLLGDGTVRIIAQTIDHWVYQYLGAKADGQTFPMP